MYIVFDIGGTKTRIATSSDLVTLDVIQKIETSLSYQDGFLAVTDIIDTLSNGKQINGIAGGIRGPLNHEKTGIVSESKLTNWVGRSIVADLKNEYNCPVFLENDTAIVGLGEVTFGAGKGYPIVAYHTVSTGVGGARFVHGKLDIASAGFEPGHQILDIDRTILGVSATPTLENLVSGASLEKRRGVKPYEISQEDPVWEQLAEFLASGLKNTVVYWSPDAIVLGGSMIVGDPRIPLEAIQKATEKILSGFVPCPKILDASLKDDGGLYGAMALLMLKLDS